MSFGITTRASNSLIGPRQVHTRAKIYISDGQPTLPTLQSPSSGSQSVPAPGGVSQPTQHLEKIWRNIQIFGNFWRNYLILLALPRGLEPLFSP